MGGRPLAVLLALLAGAAHGAEWHAFTGRTAHGYEIRVGADPESTRWVVSSREPLGAAVVSVRHGVLLYVSHETRPPSLIAQKLQTGQRRILGPVADPHGVLTTGPETGTYVSATESLAFDLRNLFVPLPQVMPPP